MSEYSSAGPKGPYSLECFRDVADRRGKEAKHLLELPKKHKHWDGAVTCALLATECALKATLIFGSGVKYDHELPADVQKVAFKGSSGHDLAQLLSLQPALIRRAEAFPLEAVRRLHCRKRYEHRYGHKRPPLLEARPVVEDAGIVIEWMRRIVK